MRLKSKINFNVLPNKYSNINLEGTGLALAEVDNQPVVYYPDSAIDESIEIQGYYKTSIILPKDFELCCYNANPNDNKSGYEEGVKLPNNFQMNLIFDIEPISENSHNYTSVPPHDMYVHPYGEDYFNDKEVISIINLFSDYVLGISPRTACLSPIRTKNRFFFYKYKESYFFPVLFPTFASAFYTFKKDQNNSVSNKAKIFFEQECFKNNIKQFPFLHSSQIECSEDLSGILLVKQVAVLEQNRDNPLGRPTLVGLDSI